MTIILWERFFTGLKTGECQLVGSRRLRSSATCSRPHHLECDVLFRS